MKKLLNGIAGALCVMAVCVFAGCSSPSGGAEPAPAQQGDIVYSDGTWSADYNSSKTAVGIVLIPDVAVGIPYKIVGLQQSSEIQWAYYQDDNNKADGYSAGRISLGEDDGSENWESFINNQGINDANVSGRYPAFEFCNSLNSSDPVWKWYLPAVKELKKIYEKKEIIKASLNKLPEGTYSLNLTDSISVWSSSIEPGSNPPYNTAMTWNVVDNYGASNYRNENHCTIPIAIYKQSSN